MYGALSGDIIGAPYEFDRGNKTKEFPLFSRESKFTDDSVMTVAVAEALMDSMGLDDEAVKAALVKSMVKWGRKYPNAGYGAKFYWWLKEENPQPYGSFGNGSAMRVSSAGWLYDTLEETRHMARLTAEVSHNHPEGIKGAEAIASAIFMARTGSSKEEIKEYIIREFGYDLSRTCDEIRPDYYHIETCQMTVPEAITAFMEGNDFEDVVRTAVSLGGDCDTLTDIAAGIAEAFYGIPEEIKKEVRKRLPEDMLKVVDRFPEQNSKTDMKITFAGMNDEDVETGNDILRESSAFRYKIAEKSDWKTYDMPAQRETFILDRTFTEEQMAALRKGNIPREMEDKWFWYMTGNTLYAHRSWTGFCNYIIEFRDDGHHLVTVSRDPEQYECTDIEADRERVNDLLDWWTKAPYDYYNEWLFETVKALDEQGMIPEDQAYEADITEEDREIR